ncbi:Oidioi.mRNA.OKI2018_I69.chr2.g6861.t1.cds [Oikopleura dioica]|uniref:Oidioi.mRNA.OKI2018_I69.chr2.g6861.t1.cds n=1 Tax=Oikopleura dioica TaxID=34765 RepID=A0ABN7T5C1_OIKDI|nr:Oidioi.mRNA.OKI2018_I69.chr2.g6861.t1.cds [Oikopleura dioica]
MEEILIEDGNGENYDILAGDKTCEFDDENKALQKVELPEIQEVTNLNNTQSSQEPEKQDSGIEDKDSIPNSPTAPVAPVSKLELHAKSWKPKVKTARQIRAERFHAEQKRKALAEDKKLGTQKNVAAGAFEPQQKNDPKKESQVQSRKPRFPGQFRKPTTRSFPPKPAGPSANRTWDPQRRRSAPPSQIPVQRQNNGRKSPPKPPAQNRPTVQKGQGSKGPSPKKTGPGKNKKKSLSPQKKVPLQMSNGQRQAIVKSIAPKKAKKSKSPSKDLIDGMEKAKLVIDNLHITVNYKKGQRTMNVDSPVSIRKKQASQELLQMIKTKSPPKPRSTEKEKEHASKQILGMINPFGSSSNNQLKKDPKSPKPRAQKTVGPPFQKQFSKKPHLKPQNSPNTSPGKLQKFQKTQKRKHKIEDTRVVISDPEIRSDASSSPEKINEENLSKTLPVQEEVKPVQILVQEEDEEVSLEEDEATTVATVIEKTLTDGIENVTLKAEE